MARLRHSVKGSRTRLIPTLPRQLRCARPSSPLPLEPPQPALLRSPLTLVPHLRSTRPRVLEPPTPTAIAARASVCPGRLELASPLRACSLSWLELVLTYF
ncbi:hypothetical protein FRC09_019089, partial [Ceratobasidium sp. 395]